MFTLGKCNVLVRFGTVINYSVNCCTTVPYRTEPYSVGSLASVGLVRYSTVRYGTLGNGSVNTVLLFHAIYRTQQKSLRIAMIHYAIYRVRLVACDKIALCIPALRLQVCNILIKYS